MQHGSPGTLVVKSLLNSSGITPVEFYVRLWTSQEISCSHTLQPKICVHLPRWTTSMMLLDIGTALVVVKVWKSVYHMHGSFQCYMYVTEHRLLAVQ